jgi:hypothetical protein
LLFRRPLRCFIGEDKLKKLVPPRFEKSKHRLIIQNTESDLNLTVEDQRALNEQMI